MKKAGFLTSASTAAALTFAQSALADDTIDNPRYAANLGNHIISVCSEGTNTQPCLSGTMDAVYTIASDLSSYIKDVITPTHQYESGMAQGDLLANCETPLNEVTSREYSTFQNFQAAALGATESCIDSIRRAETAVGIEFQPTAVNTIANHVNCIQGEECITQSYAPRF